MAPPRSLRRRWIAAFLVGELAGFVPPAATGAALAAAGAGDALLVGGLVAAGFLEGAVLGWAQAAVLRGVLPAVRFRDWVLATAAGAALAWAAGMSASPLLQRFGLVALVAVGPALMAGWLAMGVLQWRVLRRAAPRSGRWVPVTALAWLVGVAIPVVALGVVPNGWPLPVHAAVGVAAALAMGATVGALTAGALERVVTSAAGSSGRSPARVLAY